MRAQVKRLVRQGCDLSLRQMFVLFECMDAERTVKELFEAGGPKMDKPAVTRAVDRLITTGYARRKEHPVDRRSVLIYLTAAGRKFAEAAQQP